MEFGEIIIHWYHRNKRDLPWRNTKDPYKIWLSEIILQQTRVDQGLAYYHRFIKQYPNVKKLASAKEGAVLKLWQGLGYYSRARNLHYAAKDIVKRFGGKFPKAYEDIRSLKGVGEYTAAAITSFAFNEPYAVVDGNVFRLLSRYLGISTPINSSRAKKEFYEAAMMLLDKHSPHDFNQAMMEFGSLQCKPVNPSCEECPLNNSCLAFARKKVKELPVKNSNWKIRKRYFYYSIIHHGDNILLKKRTGSDIWKNLYDFPLVESSRKISTQKLLKSDDWKKIFGNKSLHILKESKTFTHQLSHQKIYAKFFEIKPGKKFLIDDIRSLIKAPVAILQIGNSKSETRNNKYAVPKLIENYLKLRESMTFPIK